MSFKLPYQHNKFTDYVFVLFIIAGAYILGNIPALLFLTDGQTDDLFNSLIQKVGSTSAFALLLLPLVFVFFAFLLSVKFVLKWPINSVFTSRSSFDYKRFGFGFSLWFGLSLITFFAFKNELVFNNFDTSKFLKLFFVAVVVLLIQCAAEELVFRSFIIKWIGRKGPKVLLQILVPGIIFGYLHGSNPEIDALGKIALTYYIGTGIFLGFLTIIDDGLELSIGFHFANNLFATLIVSNNWQVFQTDAIFIDTNPPSFTLLDFVISLGGQLLFLAICWKVYRWNFAKINQ